MTPLCILDDAGLLTGIQLSNVSDQDESEADRLFDDFANSRENIAGSQIARDLIHAIDNGSINIGSLEILSRYCHTGGAWAPCIDPARAISRWLTGGTGLVIPRLVDEDGQPVEDYQALCQQIINFVGRNSEA
jgi:hypothetical protein